MTQLNELINKHIDSIKFNGCQLSKEMLTLMFDGVVALAKIQESFEISQRYLDSIGTAFGNGGNDQPDPHKGFIVGEVYKLKDDKALAYYCGLNEFGTPVFELLEVEGVNTDIPKDWIHKGNNTYWGYSGLEKEFDPTPIIMPNTIGQHITEPEFIQPNEMVKGKWYVALSIGHNWKWLFKYDCVEKGDIVCQHLIDIESNSKYMNARFARFPQIKDLRPATIEEVTKYFPNEFDSNVTEHPNKY